MEWIRDHLWETWLALSITLGVAEMFSLDLVLVMLAAGALAGAVAALLNLDGYVQVGAAVVVSVAMLGVVRPTVARRLHGGPQLSQGHEKLVGARAMVTEEVTPLSAGRIKVGGEIWTALPYDDSTIAVGEAVDILAIKGATAYVETVLTLDI